jgi:hypothetical protein
MKTYLPLTFIFAFFSLLTYGQFNQKSYTNFRETVKDLTFDELNDLNSNQDHKYYKGYNLTPNANEIVYLDSVIQKLKLTSEEQELLMQNHFVVTERLNSQSFGGAYQTQIFNNDLPVFVSTDLILHALHTSYDNILKGVEGSLMMPNIKEYITDLYNNLPAIDTKYGGNLPVNIGDVDLYLTVALSLINDTKLQTRYANQENYNQIMEAIEGETMTDVQLFTNPKRTRKIDFSQFKVRGHYVYTEADKWNQSVNLEPYFKTMMWLGRIDFFMTPPPTGGEEPWKFDEIQRMNVSAFILNEMMQASSKKTLLQQNNEIVTYLVGESDNLTSEEYAAYTQSKGISDATQLMDSLVYVDYFDGLSTNPEFEQKYMGAFYYVDVSGDKPDVLPVSFLMSGQRFIIDSYVFANVVFDRIIYKGAKVERLMPDPLDAIYSLGNNDALHFLKDELATYPYATQLALMRYLIDAKEPQFWNESLYNAWLSSIRALNPAPDSDKMPFFMRTGAWHQQKMNTQLAAWTQVRHDNLLYAKPSYTGGMGCSFPYSYVEPYPEFFKRLGDYADGAAQFFSGKEIRVSNTAPVDQYFRKFAEVMSKLEILAQKELDNQPFNEEEENWLKQMLIKQLHQECGAMPFTGWILDLYWNAAKVTESDFINVDIHTQPTDKYGNMVGKVLHAGLGEINLGVCLAKIPGSNTTAAYTGAFMSYYEYITDNFLRVNDQEWEKRVLNGNLPERPEWVNSYLANVSGKAYTEQKTLPTSMLVGSKSLNINESKLLAKVYPNPATNFFTIQLSEKNQNPVIYSLFDICGRIMRSGLVFDGESVDLTTTPKGIYLVKLSDGKQHQFIKVVKD